MYTFIRFHSPPSNKHPKIHSSTENVVRRNNPLWLFVGFSPTLCSQRVRRIAPPVIFQLTWLQGQFIFMIKMLAHFVRAGSTSRLNGGISDDNRQHSAITNLKNQSRNFTLPLDGVVSICARKCAKLLSLIQTHTHTHPPPKEYLPSSRANSPVCCCVRVPRWDRFHRCAFKYICAVVIIPPHLPPLDHLGPHRPWFGRAWTRQRPGERNRKRRNIFCTAKVSHNEHRTRCAYYMFSEPYICCVRQPIDCRRVSRTKAK